MFMTAFNTISVDTKNRLQAFVHQISTAVLKIYKTQLQVGCGLFAIIAHATDMAFGHQPASHEYCQKQMRRHYEQWIADKQLTPLQQKQPRVVDQEKNNYIIAPKFCGLCFTMLILVTL